MLRYASLYAGYGAEYVKKIIPYAQDYYARGLTVLQPEKNPLVLARRKANSGTSGDMGDIREQIGMPRERKVSDEALAEVQFISDVSGMTKLMERMLKTDDAAPKTRQRIEKVETVKTREGKFAGFPEEQENA